MRFRVSKTGPAAAAGDLLVFPVFQKDDKADLGPLRRALGLKGQALAKAVAGANPEARSIANE